MTDKEKLVERVAEALWANLDLNGHTLDGVKRAARAALAAIPPPEALASVTVEPS